MLWIKRSERILFLIQHLFMNSNNVPTVESYMRRVVKPLEALLVSHKRIVLKDSAVSINV